ncbi:iron exporter MbfA [Maritalea sp. S77]|jgi:rubrerythrin|uniref:iron exporter MbfA n=1 Tax=Maritalea sp. S77 TaxID=3415125 RepID=UPI003C7C33A0
MLNRVLGGQRRRFDDLSEAEILALAISAEEDDARIYAAYAEMLRDEFPASAKVFDGMKEEENEHRGMLIDMFKKKFGDNIPLVRREHVKGFLERKPFWLMKNLPLETIRQQAWEMEEAAQNFYLEALKRTKDANIRKLLGDLALAEQHHKNAADDLSDEHLGEDALEEEDKQKHRKFVLTYVQPGLAGLMDGSVSTLAPIFAAAFATHSTWETFLVGLAASIGAGISMGFTEAASDDGKLTGRGSPIKRGFASGIMTTIGGLGHALPYLIADFWTATITAIIVVFIELWVIAYIQNKYMDTPFWRAVMQVVFGGSLVFAAGILIGNA